MISIIIPTYNRVHLIGETLDSIIAQTFTYWECIVVDDGSLDYTGELMDFYTKLDSRIKYVLRPENLPKGANSCRNYGFEISKGKYVNWFDSDDIMHPRKLDLQIKEIEKEKSFLCVCQTQVFKETIENDLGIRHPHLISNNFWDDYLMFKIYWGTPSPLWRRDFLLKMGKLFDVELHAAQEWEFHLRALSQIEFYTVVKKSLVFVRIHEVSISQEKREKVLWYYFLARYNIYFEFRDKLSPGALSFLRKYFLDSYKSALKNSQWQLASKIWSHYFFTKKHMSIYDRLHLSWIFIRFLFIKRENLILW